MASKTALPIARLRALGCRVSTTISHVPAFGDFQYGITLPQGFAVPPSGAVAENGHASVRRAQYNDQRLIVSALLYQTGKPMPSKIARAEAERDVAALLSKLADVLNGRAA